MPADQSALRQAVERATLHESVRDFAKRAGVAHETLYRFLRGEAITDRVRRRLEESLGSVGPAAAPVAPPAPPVPAGRHEPSFWEGRLTSAADALDAMYAMLGVVRTDLRGVLASGVLHGAPQPAPNEGQSEWRPMEPPGPDAAARARVLADQARQAAKERQGRNATPPARRRRAGG